MCCWFIVLWWTKWWRILPIYRHNNPNLGVFWLGTFAEFVQLKVSTWKRRERDGRRRISKLASQSTTYTQFRSSCALVVCTAGWNGWNKIQKKDCGNKIILPWLLRINFHLSKEAIFPCRSDFELMAPGAGNGRTRPFSGISVFQGDCPFQCFTDAPSTAPFEYRVAANMLARDRLIQSLNQRPCWCCC